MNERDIAVAVPSGDLVEIIGVASDIVDITHDSRQVQPGWAFACIVGATSDGHDFAAQAVSAGATLLLVERRLPFDVAQIVVRDVRLAVGHVAAAVHGHPSRSLQLVGITGTNGKTTTTHLLGAILRHVGLEEREMGTLSGSRTTPEATDLQRRLAEYVRAGVDAVVMEVSSHALALFRTNGTRFDVAVFTNLGRDHLDLHESMEAYFRAKASLFGRALSDRGVTNLDDPHGQLLVDASDIEMVGFSINDVTDIELGIGSHAFTWRGRRVTVPVGGAFNIMNSLAALLAAEQLGIDLDAAVAGLALIPPVPGRFELVSDPTTDPFAVIVDYAHTADGLDELLASARRLVNEQGSGRVIIVFGCGGDRDHDKRPLMGAAAVRGADLAILTSDNPRSEDPAVIIDETAAGVENSYRDRLVIEIDRRRAIDRAIVEAAPGDVVLIAGKGHETTQTIGDAVLPFDDRVVARELLTARTGPNATGAST